MMDRLGISYDSAAESNASLTTITEPGQSPSLALVTYLPQRLDRCNTLRYLESPYPIIGSPLDNRTCVHLIAQTSNALEVLLVVALRPKSSVAQMLSRGSSSLDLHCH